MGSLIFLFKHRIVALSGEECRNIFFTDKTLDLTEGYMIVMGDITDKKLCPMMNLQVSKNKF